jgi:hypothetical protein
VLRAAVEIGATNTVTAETMLRTRIAMAPKPASDWWDRITRLMVRLALPPVHVPPTGIDLQKVNELANAAEVPFLIRWAQFNIVPAHFVVEINPQPFAADIYAGLAASPEYTAPSDDDTRRLRIIVDQGQLARLGAAHIPTFYAGITATGLAANGFQSFLDLAVLAPHGAALLPVGGGAPTVPQIRLALAWLARDRTNPDVIAFLTAQVLHPVNAPAAFPPAISAEITAANRTDRDVLTDLGIGPGAAGTPPVGGGAPPQLANIALPGSATNTLVLTGRAYLAQVTAAPHATPRMGPGMAFAAAGALATGTSVRVMGSTAGWSAVDIGGSLRFVRDADLSPPPP